MIHSYNLLNEFIDIGDLQPAEIAEKLTFAGFEVESLRPLIQASGLISGRILSCLPHPDSDHLHLLKVDCGPGVGILDIVCGAPNARTGLNVIVALPGAELPAIGVTIKKGVIRGYESNGMCCSLLELGLERSVLSENSPSLTGIEELSPDYAPGDTELIKNLGLDDYLFDINVLANRPDCLSVWGMAKELSAVLDRPLRPDVLPNLDTELNRIVIRSESAACQAFHLLEIDGFAEVRTPLKIVRYLQALGIRSINLIVDIGNFSMLVTGQPLHMYDLAKIAEPKFIVKDDFDGEFVALDDHSYTVVPGDVVVTDGAVPLCLGGVMGGQSVECDENTTHIGIEAAHFYHAAIRHTVSRTGLASDSSARFIKGVNPALIEDSLRYTLKLLQILAPEVRLLSYSKYEKLPVIDNTVHFDLNRLNRRLGTTLETAAIDEILRRIRVRRDNDVLYPPYDRQDLKEQCDIEEEVFRLSSPALVPLSLASLPETGGGLTFEQQKRRLVREHLIARGFLEALTYTLVDQAKIVGPLVFSGQSPYKVKNPMTADHMYVRTAVLPSLVEAATYNRDRKNTDFDLFEIAAVDTVAGHAVRLALVMSGYRHDRGQLKVAVKNFYDIKGVVEGVLSLLGIDSKRYTLKPSVNVSFHPGRSADLLIGSDLIGTFGEFHPSLGYKDMLVGELNLTKIMAVRTGKTKFQPFSVYPSVTRDLSFSCPLDLTAGELLAVARKAGGALLKNIEVFDVFEKEDQKSMALKMTLSADHTLAETEINAAVEQIVKTVTAKLKASLKK